MVEMLDRFWAPLNNVYTHKQHHENNTLGMKEDVDSFQIRQACNRETTLIDKHVDPSVLSWIWEYQQYNGQTID